MPTFSVRSPLLGLVAALLAAFAVPAGAEIRDPARPAGEDGIVANLELPQILSAADAARYRRIFELQEDGHWREADREIKALDDDLLMGHVLAQRYLHPTRYRSRYTELRDWLKRYYDHPQAGRIYKLAMRRKPSNWLEPRHPTYAVPPRIEDVSPEPYASSVRRTPRQAREARRLIAQARRYAQRGTPSRAYAYVHSSHALRVLDPVEQDMAAAHVAAGFFFLGDTRKALANAAPAAERSGEFVNTAHWIAGLSAFRLGSYARAARHFEGMATSPQSARWTRTAGAFWAARSHMYAQQPDQVSRWLAMAAHETTFYGLLARRVFGVRIAATGEPPELTQMHVDLLTAYKPGRRALALLQADDAEDAERELRGLARRDDGALAEALIALSGHTGLPALSLLAASLIDDEGQRFAALYPLPRWTPDGGFTVDRALIYAFMRQESGFNPRAKSHAGARGLMQLMPGTAGFVAKRRFRGWRRGELYDPEYNVELGQRYIGHLIQHPAVNGDLLLLAAAYNGGPGNLGKWLRDADRRDIDDALMFIESIPSSETRNFIERVLANLWIYRARMGQPSPSLDALAAGRRPIYKSLDPETRPVASHAGN